MGELVTQIELKSVLNGRILNRFNHEVFEKDYEELNTCMFLSKPEALAVKILTA